jgi:surfeit locus 1 family protein
VSAIAVRPGRAGLLVPALAAAAAVAICLGLGTWQIQRKAWKEALIDTLEQRLSAPPVSLPPPARWAVLDAASTEFLRVTFRASFVPGAEALVYAAASALRPDAVGPGYWVLALARTDAGTVIVNRGFVPERLKDPASRPETISASAELTGVLRWPEQRGTFSPADHPEQNLWFVRDPAAIAAAKGWGKVAPFYLELESPVPAANLPRPGRLQPRLRNPHLGYALTWYGLAGAMAAMLGAWLIQRRRQAAV